jgi:AraC-like DNA-binding protein
LVNQGTTLAGTAEAFGRVLAKYQIDAQSLFTEAGISREDLRDAEARLPIDKLTRVWGLAVARTNNPCLGFEVGQAILATNLAAFGYAWLASLTLRRALRRLVRLQRTITTGIEFTIHEAPDVIELKLLRYAGTPTQGLYAAMCVCVALVRQITHPEFAPSAVEFRGPAPPCLTELEDFFGCPPRFEAENNRIVISAAGADDALPRSNATMVRLADEAAHHYLATVDKADVVSRVRSAILELLPDGEPAKQVVAQRLALSERTLTRRLVEREASFRELVDDVRKELAIAYMGRPDQSVLETALILGFTDQSNFARAFKRWTGQSPTTYRLANG